jgi:hypothetical protein
MVAFVWCYKIGDYLDDNIKIIDTRQVKINSKITQLKILKYEVIQECSYTD